MFFLPLFKTKCSLLLSSVWERVTHDLATHAFLWSTLTVSVGFAGYMLFSGPAIDTFDAEARRGDPDWTTARPDSLLTGSVNPITKRPQDELGTAPEGTGEGALPVLSSYTFSRTGEKFLATDSFGKTWTVTTGAILPKVGKVLGVRQYDGHWVAIGSHGVLVEKRPSVPSDETVEGGR